MNQYISDNRKRVINHVLDRVNEVTQKKTSIRTTGKENNLSIKVDKKIELDLAIDLDLVAQINFDELPESYLADARQRAESLIKGLWEVLNLRAPKNELIDGYLQDLTEKSAKTDSDATTRIE